MKRFFLFVSAFVTLFSVLEAQNYEPVKAHEANLPFVSEQEMVDGFHKVFGQKRTKAWIPNDRVSKYYALTNVRVLENVRTNRSSQPIPSVPVWYTVVIRRTVARRFG